MKYFEDWQEDRAMFTCSRDYVLGLTGSLMKYYSSEETETDGQSTYSTNDEEDNGNGKKRKSRSTSPSPAGKSKKKSKKSDHKLELIPPESELGRIAEFHSLALGDSIEKDLDHKNYSYGVEFLVGKPVRLYCPIGNSYHVGRIIDWRRATNFLPNFQDLETAATTSISENKLLFYGEGDIASTEFLVRFLSGMNGRKKILYQWMILEEHSLAVGTSVIWGQIGNFKGMQGWKPAQILLRTSLELVPIAKHQNTKTDDDEKDIFAFTMFFGGQFYALLSLRKEATDFLSVRFHTQTSISSIGASSENTNVANTTSTKNAKNLDVSYAVAMAKAEIEEQKRVRYWHKLPLQNAMHNKALTLVDESSLPPLKIQDSINADSIPANSAEGHGTSPTTTILPKLCPLISLGLDRIWLTETLGNIEESLDCLNSITVESVSSIQSAIAQLHEESC